MHYPELASSAATTILADLKTAKIAITPATTTYLAALDNRTRCWKGIFVATATWLAQATTQEQAVAWLSIVKICGMDMRPLAAMSRLFYFQSNAQALKTLWLALPSDALPELRVCLAANPLLLAMFSDPASGVTGLPTALRDSSAAADLWIKVQAKMTKLSRYENPAST